MNNTSNNFNQNSNYNNINNNVSQETTNNVVDNNSFVQNPSTFYTSQNNVSSTSNTNDVSNAISGLFADPNNTNQDTTPVDGATMDFNYDVPATQDVAAPSMNSFVNDAVTETTPVEPYQFNNDMNTEQTNSVNTAVNEPIMETASVEPNQFNNEVPVTQDVVAPNMNSFINEAATETPTVEPYQFNNDMNTTNPQPVEEPAFNYNNQNINQEPATVTNNVEQTSGEGIDFNSGFNHVSLDTRLEDASDNAPVEQDTNDEVTDEELDEVEVLEYEYVPVNAFKRICADIIDQFIIIVLVIAVYIAVSTIFMFVDSSVLELIVYVLMIIALTFGNLIYRTFNEKNGSTIGRKATKTIVLTSEHENITVVTALLRTLVATLINATGIGFIINVVLITIDKRKQGIEDRLFKTEVIDSGM